MLADHDLPAACATPWFLQQRPWASEEGFVCPGNEEGLAYYSLLLELLLSWQVSIARGAWEAAECKST